MMEYSFKLNDAKIFFNNNGYFLLKEGFASDIAFEASEWLKSQNLENLASTWTEQEPGVSLAVYQNIHKGNSPISQIASNPKMLKIASHFMNDNVMAEMIKKIAKYKDLIDPSRVMPRTSWRDA